MKNRLLTLASLSLLCLGFAHAAPKNAAPAKPAAPVPPPPGVVVATSPAPKNTFIGSPSIVILPDGSYLVSHDFFGAKSDPALLHSSRVFISKDKGATWTQTAAMKDQFWSTLFYHDGAVYMLGTNREYGEIMIRRSTDGGRTWTEPKDGSTGALTTPDSGKFHCAPVPVVVYKNRLWRAFEDYTGTDGKWSGLHFRALVISAPFGSDLLDAKSWTLSNRIPFQEEWLPGPRNGWLEGNLVPTPDGRLMEIMRLNDDPVSPSAEDHGHTGLAAGIPRYETGALLQVENENTLRFDPKSGLIHFPGSQTKFTVRYDPVSKRYWSLVNKITNPAPGYDKAHHPRTQRNVIMLTSSPDLRNWTEHSIILRWGQGRALTNRSKFGFQYLDWQFEGGDIVAVSRTAWDGYNIHNANCVTFHRVKNFRTLTMADSSPDLAPPEK